MGGLLVERLASGGLGAGRIAWLTTRRILISLCCFSFFSFFFVGLWLVWALVESLSLLHAGDFQHGLLLFTFYFFTVACIYNINGKCKGMLTHERRNVLQRAFKKAKYSGLHDNIHPPPSKK
jgi:hypothetical protein